MTYADASALVAAHALGAHKKLPRQKCPECRAAAGLQWRRGMSVEDRLCAVCGLAYRDHDGRECHRFVERGRSA